MTAFDIFVYLFHVLDHAYDSSPEKQLGNFLSAMNPFLFEGENSADPAVFDKFKKDYALVFQGKDAPISETYEFCRSYLQKAHVKAAVRAFESIAPDKWCAILEKAAKEQ